MAQVPTCLSARRRTTTVIRSALVGLVVLIGLQLSAPCGWAQPAGSGTEVESVGEPIPDLVPAAISDSVPAASLSDLSDTRDVIFMIRTKDFRDLNTLRGDLTVAGSRAGAQWPENGLHLEAIDNNAWRKLRMAFGMGDDGHQADGFQLTSGDGIQLLATEKENFFQIRVAPDRELSEAQLTYRVAGSDPRSTPEKVTYVPGKQTDDPADKPLRFDNDGIGGHYTLTLPPNWHPESITVSAGAGKPDVHYQWPQNSLVLGRIEDFQGSLTKMFDTLKDRDIMGVPLKGFEQSQNLTVVVADFVRDFANVTVDWVNSSELRVRVPYNQEVPSNRIWFLFPLDNDATQKAQGAFRDRLPQGDYDLSTALRGTANPYPIVEESDPPVIDPSGDPNWLQLPLVLDEKGGPLRFERTYRVDNRDILKERYPNEVKALYLYEKDTGTPKFPHRVVPIEGKDGLQHLIEQTMQGWQYRGR